MLALGSLLGLQLGGVLVGGKCIYPMSLPISLL